MALVYLWVRAYIEENKFSSSTKIPSEHTLSRRLAVSRETVRRALERLTPDFQLSAAASQLPGQGGLLVNIGAAALHPAEQPFLRQPLQASLLNPNLDCYQKIYQKRIPVIFYNNYYRNLKCPRVVVNDLRCAEELIGLLIQQGHRNIAGIFVSDNYQSIESSQSRFRIIRVSREATSCPIR